MKSADEIRLEAKVEPSQVMLVGNCGKIRVRWGPGLAVYRAAEGRWEPVSQNLSETTVEKVGEAG